MVLALVFRLGVHTSVLVGLLLAPFDEMQQFRCFDSAARFCHAHDEVRHFFRFPPPGRRPVPLRWQRRLRHQQFTMLQKMMLAA